jgi:predicted amidohydrolase
MATPTETVLACCQLAPRVAEPRLNRAAASQAIVDAHAQGADVVVLPELAVSGYVFEDSREALSLAEPLDGPTVTGWIQLARELDIAIVGGVCELDSEFHALRNTAVLVDGRGLRAAYRKAHLWDREAEVFTPGSARPPVIETDYGRIGLMVCYDVEFPEWVRLPALDGVELLCAPVNWPRSPHPEGERPGELVRLQAAASTNRIFIAACDRAGHERGVDWIGGSVIVDPDGFPIAGPADRDEALTLIAACRLSRATDKRVGDRNDVLADRRPELY